MDNKNFSEKMKRHGVTLDAFKTYPPPEFNFVISLSKSVEPVDSPSFSSNS